MNPLNSNSPINNFGQQNIFTNPRQQNTFTNPRQINDAQLKSNAHKVKQIMQRMSGNPQALIREFPELGMLLKQPDLKGLFMSMCQECGVNPSVILNELRS